MKRRGLRIVVAVLSLLAFTTSARAECAWVLWGHEVTRNTLSIKRAGEDSRDPGTPTWEETWSIAKAYPKLAACEAARSPRLRQWTQLMEGGGYDVSLTEGGDKAWAVRRGSDKSVARGSR